MAQLLALWETQMEFLTDLEPALPAEAIGEALVLSGIQIKT